MKLIKYLILLLILTHHTTQTAGQTLHIDDLTDEIMLKVFQYVCTPLSTPQDYAALSSVNKNWHRIAQDPSIERLMWVWKFHRPVHYIRELLNRHPNVTPEDLYARFCKEQEEELTALEIEHTPLQEELTWEEYHARETLIENRNTEIMKGMVLKCRELHLGFICITFFNGTRIPTGVWQRLREDPEITEQDLDKMVVGDAYNTQYRLRFIPPCFFEGMRFKTISLPNQNLIALPNTLENTIGDLRKFDIRNCTPSKTPNILHTFPDVLFSCPNLTDISINNTSITQSAQMLDLAFPRATIFFSDKEKNVISEEGYARRYDISALKYYRLLPKLEEKKEESGSDDVRWVPIISAHSSYVHDYIKAAKQGL